MVALDGVMATALGIAALSLASEEPAVALLPLGVGALYLGGAVSGNRAVNKCREAIADYEGSYNQEYADSSRGRLIPRESRRRPADPYSEQPAYPRPQQTPYSEQPAYPPPQPQRPQPAQPTQPPPAQEQPPQPPPAKQPRQAPPPQADGDWTDFWREVP